MGHGPILVCSRDVRKKPGKEASVLTNRIRTRSPTQRSRSIKTLLPSTSINNSAKSQKRRKETRAAIAGSGMILLRMAIATNCKKKAPAAAIPAVIW